MSLDKFSDMLRFGINLKLSGVEEEKYYSQRLRYFIMDFEDFDAESEDDVVVDVFFLTEKTFKVKIRNSTLTFEPLTETSYEAVMLVLDFISKYHDIVKEDFLKTDAFEETVVKVPLMEEQSEEDSSDEWI